MLTIIFCIIGLFITVAAIQLIGYAVFGIIAMIAVKLNNTEEE